MKHFKQFIRENTEEIDNKKIPFAYMSIGNREDINPYEGNRSTIVDASNWRHEEGTQAGSNEGGIHYDEKGTKHYAKWYRNPQQARVEVASARIHELAGVKTLKPFLIKHGDKIGVASVFNTNVQQKPKEYFETLNQDQAHHIGAIHHAAVLTKNWDTVGLVHDNILFDKETGIPHSVDQGGSFEFRAQGEPKSYTPDVAEIESFRSGLNREATHAFGHTFTNYPEAEKNSLSGIRNMRYEDVHKVFKDVGFDDHKQRADTLWKRRELLLKHYGMTAE